MKSTLKLLALATQLRGILSSMTPRHLRANDLSPRIVGGSDAEVSRYSYAQVSLQDEGGHFCGGSLIAPDIVLTAAHCVIDADPKFIHFNRYNLSDDSEIFEIFAPKKVTLHPRYNDFSSRFDVAVIKLNGNVTLIEPIKVNDLSAAPISGQTLTVVGWGATQVSFTDITFPDLFQEVDVPYVPNAKCKAIEERNGFSLGSLVTQEMMCAGKPGKDSCYGDSGSALIMRGNTREEDLQVGIVSWGVECGGVIPGVYNRLSRTHQWVRKRVCQYSESPPDDFKCFTPVPTVSPAPSQAPSLSPSGAPNSEPTNAPGSGEELVENEPAKLAGQAQPGSASTSSRPGKFLFFGLASCMLVLSR